MAADVRAVLVLAGAVTADRIGLLLAELYPAARVETIHARDAAVRALVECRHDICLLADELDDGAGVDVLQRVDAVAAPPIVMLGSRGGTAADLAADAAGAAEFIDMADLSPALLDHTIRYTLKHHRAEIALRASEQRYRELVEGVDAIVWEMDATTWQFTFVSAKAEALLGYPTERWLNEAGFWENTLVVDADRDRVMHHCRMATDLGLDHDFLYRARAADGTILWLHDIVRVTRSPDGILLRGVMFDVTAQKSTETALRDSEQRYRDLVEHSPDALLLHEDDRIVFANPAAAVLFGCPRDALIGRSIFDLIDRRDHELARSRRREVLEESRHVPPVQFRLVRGDGERVYGEVASIPFDFRGRPTVQTVIRDVTARVQSQEAAHSAERRFRSLIENALDAVALIDENGTLLYMSPSAERIHGWSADEVVGTNSFGRIHPEDQEVAGYALRALREDPATPRMLELRLAHREGGWRAVELVAQNRLDDPAVAGIVLNIRDVTETREMAIQLRQSQKMEAVGMLAGGIAHDFNNVLTAIQGHLSLARESLPPGSSAAADVDEAERSARRAADLTRQLLAFSRRQVLRPSFIDLGAVIRDMQPMLRRLIGEHIAFETRVDGPLGTVHADVTQLQQVVLNLCVNARDAMPDGGRLAIAARNEVLDESFVSQFAYPVKSGAFVMFSVTDTGEGIPLELQERIFEPFFTTKPEGSGTGLGLSTAYGIIKQSGGYIWVYSEIGQGTAFKIYLPRVDAPATDDVVDNDEDARRCAAADGLTVLVVEDEMPIRRLVCKVLERAGHTVFEADTATRALEIVRARGDTLDLVLSDVVLPGGMSGRELLEHIGEHTERVRTILMSGYPRDEVVRRDVHENRIRFLEKPFLPADLLRAVDEVMD